MAEFVGGDIKYVEVGEVIGIAPLPEPITTVKFDVRNPGVYRVEVTKDGSWTAVREYQAINPNDSDYK